MGAQASVGQYLGDESNVGKAIGTNNGRHLHFEVAVPDDPVNAQPAGFTGDFPYTLKNSSLLRRVWRAGGEGQFLCRLSLSALVGTASLMIRAAVLVRNSLGGF